MPWISDADAPTYRFLRNGSLEFRDRRGRYRIVAGCVADGYVEFEERLEAIQALLKDMPDEYPIDELYLECEEYRYLCDRVIELSGIEADWVSFKMVGWLIFPTRQGNELIEGPLVILNRPAERKYPPLPGGTPIDSQARLLASLVGACGGNVHEAIALAKTIPATQFFSVSEEINWQRADTKTKGRAWVNQRLGEMQQRGQGTVLSPGELAALRGGASG
ncbi:MAG: hypothetical protein ACFB0G_11235 [Leptolyngbyaceae cyanobacterium]